MFFERSSAFLTIIRIFVIERIAIGTTDFDDGLGQGIDPFARANVISKAALTPFLAIFPKIPAKIKLTKQQPKQMKNHGTGLPLSSVI